MNHPQTAIIPDHCKAGIFIEAGILTNRQSNTKTACHGSLKALKALQGKYPGDSPGVTIAFGSGTQAAFSHSGEGSEIKPLRPLSGGLAPATQHGIYVYIQSIHQGTTFTLSQSVLAAFGGSIHIADEVRGFHLLQERGLDGSVDGTESPQGDDKVRDVAIIPEGGPDAGGSYVLLQKYRHDLKRQDAVPVAEQEASIGRSKESNKEFNKEVQLPDSHLGHVSLKENGIGLKIIRRNLPFGTVSGEYGLMFTAYCHTLHNIEAQLVSMSDETDGKTDLLLRNLSAAVSRAYYYAPSVERLENL